MVVSYSTCARATVRILVASRRNVFASALATSSYDFATASPFVDRTFVRAAVNVVLPWSMWPMVPTFTCGFLRSNFSFAIVSSVARDSLNRHLGDDALRNRLRDLVIAFELHRVVGPALRERPERGGVAEHLRERDARRDDLEVHARLHVVDPAPAGVQVAVHGSEELVGRDDLDSHQGLEDDGVRLPRGVLERHRAGDLEGHLRGVDVVVRAVVQLDLDVDGRVAGEDAREGRLTDPLVDRLDELLGNRAARDAVDELVVLALGVRAQPDLGVPVLAPAARLADELALARDVLADRLAVRDLRLAHVRADVELAHHAVDDDLEMELAHPGDDRLVRLLVRVDAERRVFLHELRERHAHLFLVGLRLRLDCERDDGLGELHGLEDDDVIALADRVARRDVLQAHGGGDVARPDLLDLLALVRVHLQEPADALVRLLRRVVDARARVEVARVDAEERELADERVGHDLEHEARKRRLVVRVQCDLLPVFIHAADGGDVEGRREVLDDGVEKLLDALVLERRAADDRMEPPRDRRLAEGSTHLLWRRHVAVHELLHENVVGLREKLDEPLAVLVVHGLVVGRDVDCLEFRAERVVLEV